MRSENVGCGGSFSNVISRVAAPSTHLPPVDGMSPNKHVSKMSFYTQLVAWSLLGQDQLTHVPDFLGTDIATLLTAHERAAGNDNACMMVTDVIPSAWIRAGARNVSNEYHAQRIPVLISHRTRTLISWMSSRNDVPTTWQHTTSKTTRRCSASSKAGRWLFSMLKLCDFRRG